VLSEKLFCDRYVLEEKLGSGTLGDIYRATDTRSNRPVAVRLVTKVQDPLALATYYRQWAIQAGIRHENVGVILDIDEAMEDEERYPVVITPLIEGTALRDLFVQPLRNSDPKDWLVAITKAAWGLQAAHERGLIHGRLHSGNILLDRDGGVRVVDFGSSGSAKRTHGVRRDLAGLGAICFEALTSAEAPTARSDGEAALATAPATTSEISGVIVDTLWPETEGHFSSAKEFAIALAEELRSGSEESAKSNIAPVTPQGPSVDGWRVPGTGFAANDRS
jgi:serine/threonine protein kinase